MKCTLTEEQLLNFELKHHHGGGPWVMVQDIDAEYCRVIYAGPGAKTEQAFMAWKPLLTIWKQAPDAKSPMVDWPISKDTRPELDKLRDDISNGRVKVIDTRFTKAA